MELKWIAEAIPVTDGNTIFEKFDVARYIDMSENYKKLLGGEKKRFKGLDDYITKNGGPSINPLQKNYKKLLDEIDANIEKDLYYDILPVDVYSEKDTIMDLLSSLENENYIKELYRKKKLRVTGDLKSDTSVKLMDCLRQGRSLLQSGQMANMLSKPLIDFYAASAYAYASIVINSPLHKSIDSLKGSHGHTYSHLKGAIEFGGKIPAGTFIDLLASVSVVQIVTPYVRFKYITIPSLEFVQTHEINISLFVLLSMVPELHDQVSIIDSNHSIVHKLIIRSEVVNKKIAYVFEIGDGISKPNFNSLKSTFNNTDDVKDVNGKCVITILADDIVQIMPTIYQDFRGELWYIEPPIKGLYIPEICLHFLIISALCNIMRYSPHEWNNILSNKLSSDFSLLISKYLRLFELKYPMLLTQQLSNFLPLIKS